MSKRKFPNRITISIPSTTRVVAGREVGAIEVTMQRREDGDDIFYELKASNLPSDQAEVVALRTLCAEQGINYQLIYTLMPELGEKYVSKIRVSGEEAMEKLAALSASRSAER